MLTLTKVKLNNVDISDSLKHGLEHTELELMRIKAFSDSGGMIQSHHMAL